MLKKRIETVGANGLWWVSVFAVFLCFFSACFDTPYKDGRDLYEQHCASCHGDDGVGLLALIPPLLGSDYMAQNRRSLPCLIRHGMQGPIEVNGRVYEGIMPGVTGLSDAEMVNLLNYINTSFGNSIETFSLEEVRAILKECPAKTGK